MTTKPKPTKPAAPKPKRAPRQVWLVIDQYDGHIEASEALRRDARLWLGPDNAVRVVGPYVLAERVRER